MKRRRSGATAKPTPVEGIRAKRAVLADSFGKRSDRWSGLLSKAITDELRDQHLVSRSGLSAEEHQELAALPPDAHQKLGVELDQAIARLRTLLAAGDALYILSFVQDLNVFVPWGEYYEPTHQGSEAKVELVAGLLATQPAVNSRRSRTAS